MRRDPQLLQLSREHHVALRLVKRLQLDSGKQPLADILSMVAHETPALLLHFAVEERDLVPQLAACGQTQLATRLMAEHQALRHLLQSPADTAGLIRLGELLRDHVRFEERELFDVLQRHWQSQSTSVQPMSTEPSSQSR